MLLIRIFPLVNMSHLPPLLILLALSACLLVRANVQPTQEERDAWLTPDGDVQFAYDDLTMTYEDVWTINPVVDAVVPEPCEACPQNPILSIYEMRSAEVTAARAVQCYWDGANCLFIRRS